LFGTWVGTVLAYYFGHENYQSGSDNTINAVRQLSPEERLRSIPVTDVMTHPVFSYSVNDAETTKLQDIISELNERDYERLPVLKASRAVEALFYREDLTWCFPGLTAEERAAKTLKDLLDSETSKKRPYTFVGRQATLAEARDAMTKIENCKVVFVTETGRSDDAVVGMITNTDIAKHANL
jgi:predicted transcriptional regulator